MWALFLALGSTPAAADPGDAQPPPFPAVPQVVVTSWYGEKFRGRKTASGSRFDPDELTAAHMTLPFGTKLKVTSPRTKRSVVVTVTDRGPYHHKRQLDLSKGAAVKLGIQDHGVDTVVIERL